MSAAPWDPDAFREAVGTVLDELLDEHGARLADLGDDAATLLGAARQAVRGGKRLRAMFCAWGFRAVRAPADPVEERALLRAAAAHELLHASALVHDDLIDASDTRRGRPSVHRAFAGRHREAGWRGDPDQYGAAAAILLGDLLLAWSDQALRTCGLPGGAGDALAEAMRRFDTTRSEVITGQFLDLSVQARAEVDVEQSMRVLRYKSAKYSVERPLQVGAALAGGGPEVLDALTAFGLPLGEAFQLRDDLLGVFGDPEVTGKPAGDDLSEGKRTVLVALALEGSGAEDAALLDHGLGRPLDAGEVGALQGVIERSGAPTEVERRIARLTEQAVAALDSPAISVETRRALRGLAGAATQRQG